MAARNKGDVGIESFSQRNKVQGSLFKCTKGEHEQAE